MPGSGHRASASTSIMASLHEVITEILDLPLRRAVKEYLLEKTLVAAAIAAVSNGTKSPAHLLADMEAIKVQAGLVLGRTPKATVKEIDQSLRAVGRPELAKEEPQAAQN